ncbi:MAG: HAMP domain-containing histidine kinase [Oscillospiraceae bacterium]|nr:HAMP domain-containing histidine kinase [Oscillospiraceae bacterium]
MHEKNSRGGNLAARFFPQNTRSAQPRSLVTQSWLWLTGFSAFILAILWVLQFALFTPFYQTLRRREIVKTGREIVAAYEGSGDFNQILRQYAFSRNLRILLIDASGHIWGNFDGFGTIFSVGGGRVEFGRAEYERIVGDFGGSGAGEMSYIVTDDPGGGRAVYIARTTPSPSGERFLYVGSPIPPADATVSVMATQFMIITALLLLLSAAMAWLLSKRISRPILRLKDAAKGLARGEFTARTASGDYREIIELTEELSRATQELTKAEGYRRELLANVSHDLKTPLTIIRFYGEMLRDVSGDNPEKREAHCEKIIEESDRLTEMVNGLLEASKLQQAQSIELAPLRLDTLLRACAERFNPLRDREGFQFECSIEENVLVQGNQALLERAIYNLIANAVNYAGEDRRVWLRLLTLERGGAKVARVEVADAGAGIPPEELPHIWERYYKSSQPHRRGVTGSGLGLAIVKTALQLHGASFGAESELGKGSCFWVEMGAL